MKSPRRRGQAAERLARFRRWFLGGPLVCQRDAGFDQRFAHFRVDQAGRHRVDRYALGGESQGVTARQALEPALDAA